MVVVGTIVITIATLALALILSNKRIKGLSVFRIIFFVPTLVPLVILCILWIWMLQPQTGLINTFLSYLEIKGPGWLADPLLAKPAFIMIFLWISGGAVIIYLAALQDIPQSLYEVAAIDGANFLHRTFRITIPMISPVILFNVITYVIGIFQSFAESFIITSGGPNQSTLFYSLYLYQNAFQYFKMGLRPRWPGSSSSLPFSLLRCSWGWRSVSAIANEQSARHHPVGVAVPETGEQS